jgi:hypothetical protein
VRRLSWDGCHNIRDLGGLPLTTGGETRYGAIVRADSLSRLTAAGWSEALDYGVARVVDLRFAEERARDEGMPTPVEVVPISLFGERDPVKDQEWEESTRAVADLTDVFAALYVATIDDYAGQVVRAVTAVAEGNGGCVAVHCFAGKDRTGVIAALLLSLAGVDDDLIVRDFAASDEGVLRLCADWIAGAEDDEERSYRTRLVTAPAAAMATMLDHLGARWGGATSYLQAHGVETAIIDELARRLTG